MGKYIQTTSKISVFMLITLILYLIFLRNKEKFPDAKQEVKDYTYLGMFNTSSKEGFLLNKTIILLGDSILYNNSFVKKGNSVEDFLEKKKNKNITVYNYSENEETINGIYQQLSKINIIFNSANTTIFLSVGGNDILQLYNTSYNVKTLFSYYKTLIKAIKTRFPLVNLILLNIYQPINLPEYSYIIQEWNKMLTTEYGYFSILDLTKILYKPSDFTFDIEPSITGGEKIGNKILSYLS